MTKILLTLPEKYKHFSVAWDSTPSSERTIDNLRARLLKEQEKSKANGKDTKIAFNALRNQHKKTTTSCFTCGQQGHLKKDCNKNKQSKTSSGSNYKKCEKCHKGGHTIDECWSGQTFPNCKFCKATNHPEDKCYFKDQHEKQNNNSNSKKKNVNNKAQFLAEALFSNRILEKDTDFVCDSGATNHLAHGKEIMSDLQETE